MLVHTSPHSLSLSRRASEMAFSLMELLRQAFGGDKKPASPFKSEEEAYRFVKKIYAETGGVTPDLRRAYEFYKKNMDDDCPPNSGRP